MDIGKKLKEKRLEENYTQKDLAEILHVSRQTISSWEVGRTYPDLDVLIAISELYNTPLDDLLKEDSEMVKDITNKVKKSERRRLLNILLSVALIIIIAVSGYNAWGKYQDNQENAYGLKRSDLIESSWEMFYSPKNELVSSVLSFDSDSVMIRNQYGSLINPSVDPSKVQNQDVELFGYQTEQYENLKVELVENTYVVTGQGYHEIFEKLSDTAIRDTEGREYYILNQSSLHDSLQYFTELDEKEAN